MSGTMPRKERRGWPQTVYRLTARWLQIGFEPFWQLEHRDLTHEIQELKLNLKEEELFNEGERQARRYEMVRRLESELIDNLSSRLERTLWQRILRRSPCTLGEIETAFERSGRIREFEQRMKMFEARKLRILNDRSVPLFAPIERSRKFARHVVDLRRLFRRRQQKKLKLFDKYYRRLRDLPKDPIDDDITRLAEDYEFLGRTREWYREFEKLVEEATKPLAGSQDGANESMLRILQSDFLALMRNRLPVYFRYFELKSRNFRSDRADLVRNFSYFEQHLLKLHRRGIDTSRCFSDMETFVKVLEQEALAGQPKRMMNVDQSQRLEEWSDFKKQYLSPLSDVVLTFNKLRRIIVQCPDWIQELRVFRSSMLVHRLMQSNRRNSQFEMADTEDFVRRMAARIDAEIATDVAFRTLEEELLEEEEFLDELRLVRERIALERKSSGISAPERINEIKQEFVREIWDARNGEEDGAPVTPLFARIRPSSTSPEPGRFKQR
ncbi:MAG: hypothetical protein KDI19_02445 [Pseudomonadales bacterium]|nr:hypothetical protein [Pseudomonadales bacterium]